VIEVRVRDQDEVRVVRLIRDAQRPEVAVGLATGLSLRAEDGEDERRELVTDVAKALSQQAGQYGALTGKAVGDPAGLDAAAAVLNGPPAPR
jgi:hypothetical protein